MKIIVLVIYAFLILANLQLYKMNRHSKMVEYFTLLFLLVIMGGNTMCADYAEYELFYESQEYPITFEPGYTYFANFFSTSGFTFVEFRTFLFVVSFAIMIAALRNFTYNFHFICLVYLCVLFVLDAIQIRNTVGMAIFFYGITCYARGSKLKFLISIFLASLFHFSFLLFIVLLFYKKLLSIMSKHTRMIILLSLGLSLIAVSGNYFSFITTLVGMSWGESKTEYFNARYFNLVYLSVPLFFYIVSKMSNDIIKKTNYSEFVKRYSDMVYAIGVFFIFLMPILALSNNFARVYRDVAIELTILIYFVLNTRKQHIEGIVSKQFWKSYKWAIFLLLLVFSLGVQYVLGYEEILFHNVIYDFL